MLGTEGRRKDREGSIMSDRQLMSRNPVLTSQIQHESKNALCYGKFAKNLKDTESEIRGNFESFH